MKKKMKAKPKAKAKSAKKLKKKAAPAKRAKASVKKKKAVKVAKKKVKAAKPVENAKGVPRPTIIAPLNGVLLGFVEDYFAKVGVIALTLKAPVSIGQKIQVLGYTTHLDQVLDSMQIDHTVVAQAGEKAGVGIKVNGRARRGDHVYLLR